MILETHHLFAAWLMNHAHKYKLNARSASDNPIALFLSFLFQNQAIVLPTNIYIGKETFQTPEWVKDYLGVLEGCAKWIKVEDAVNALNKVTYEQTT